MTVPPERRNPAGGPGFEGQLAIDFARQAYRTRPAAGTIRAAVLDAFLTGRSLTSLEAWRELGTSRLAADVHALRRAGWPIVAEEIPVDCRAGRSARVAVYRMHRGA